MSTLGVEEASSLLVGMPAMNTKPLLIPHRPPGPTFARIQKIDEEWRFSYHCVVDGRNGAIQEASELTSITGAGRSKIGEFDSVKDPRPWMKVDRL